MSRFKHKYPAYAREAVTNAVARGLTAKQIEQQLAAGTLDGLDGNPCPMPARTIREHVQRARQRIEAGGYQVPEGVTVLDMERGFDALLKELEPEEETYESAAGMPSTIRRNPEGMFTIRWPDGEIEGRYSAALAGLVLQKARDLESEGSAAAA